MDQPRPLPASPRPHADAREADAVERALALSRLAVAPADAERFAREFERVLASFAELRRIDVSDVAPLHTPSDRSDALREDRPTPSLERDALLANAPDPREGFFGVPKTLGGAS